MSNGQYTLRASVVAGAMIVLAGVGSARGQGGFNCAPVDLVFVMDTSGSMKDEAEALCSNIAEVVAELAELAIEVNPSFLGIVEDGIDSRRFPCLTDSVLDLLGSSVPGSSSCGAELGNLEDWGAAAAIVADRFPWAEGAVRVIVPLSDEGPCQGSPPCNDPGADRDAVINAVQIANRNGVVVSPITARGANKCVVDLATDLALGTGGITFHSTDPQADLAGAIRAVVVGTCDDCALDCSPLDLVFVMDTSGSMYDEAAALCSSIDQVVVNLAMLGIEADPSFLGITEDGVANPRFPCLTDSVLNGLGGSVPGSSSCGPNLGNLEDWGAATAILADRFPWAQGAVRVIVPISDEGPCNGDPCDGPGGDRDAITNAIVIADSNEVIVSPITGTGSVHCVIELAADLAAATGGITFRSTDPEADLAAAIVAIGIDSCDGDCNRNHVSDSCDIAAGVSADCNSNDVPDECDVADGTSTDINSNSIPDQCEECIHHTDCDDGVFCTGAERCVDGACRSNGNPCSGLGLACDELRRACVCDDDGDCDDGFFCNGTENCVFGSCVPGTEPCPARFCDESADTCFACVDNRDCDDGLFCNGRETCVDGECRTSGDPCADRGLVCDEAENACDCDADADCDDADGCTADTCDVETGVCRHEPVDTDADGTPDCEDACPDTPTGAEAEDSGCACGQLDEDGDGVNNCEDVCPDTVSGAEVDASGCSCSQRDSDADGVSDCGDACPETPADQAIDRRGCSCSQKDDDDDGVVNCVDQCQLTPPGEPVDTQGCCQSQRFREEVEAGALLGEGGGSASRRGSPCGACGSVGMISVVLLFSGLLVIRRAGHASLRTSAVFGRRLASYP